MSKDVRTFSAQIGISYSMLLCRDEELFNEYADLISEELTKAIKNKLIKYRQDGNT